MPVPQSLYLLSGAGAGESSTDLAYAGPSLVAENGELLAEGDLFCRAGTLVAADVDAGYLQFARLRSAAMKAKRGRVSRIVDLALAEPEASGDLLRPLDPLPLVPSDPAERGSASRGALGIQASALSTRLAAIGAKRVVIGISGGLDSALALLVAVKAFEILGLDRSGIMAYTLPGFGTTQRTKGNAHLLCEQLRIPIETVDIAGMMNRSRISHTRMRRRVREHTSSWTRPISLARFSWGRATSPSWPLGGALSTAIT